MYLYALGTITNPFNKFNDAYGDLGSNNGPVIFISNLLKLIGVAAGLFALVNIILAGIQFISSGGNSDSISAAWKKIYMSLIGLILVVGAYAIAAIVGLILFNNPAAILSPQIYGPQL